MSDLVGNPKVRFCCDAAHFIYFQAHYECYINSSFPSFADSHTTASLRGINPEGSRLLPNSPPPIPDSSTRNNKGKPIQKPGFVVNREDSTIRGGSVPPFPPKPRAPLLRGEAEDGLKMTGEFVLFMFMFQLHPHFALEPTPFS